MNRSRLAPLAALVTLGLSGCAGTSLTQTWRDPSFSRPVSRVFIVAATPGRAQPAPFEIALAQELTARGFQATTASSVFPPGRLDKMRVREYVDKNGVDLLVMVHLSTEAAAPVVVNSTVSQSGGWYGAYGTTTASTTAISQGTDVTARIDVYDVHTEPDTLVWRGESSPVDMQGAPRSLATAIASELVKARILVK